MSSKGILARALARLGPGRAAHRTLRERDEADVRKVIARLAGGVAHDLNNILLVVQGYAEMAVEEPDAGPTVRSLLAEMRDATARASLLVRDLLLVGERAPFTPRLLDLSEVIRRRLPGIAAECPSGIEVRSSLAEGLRPVMADEDLLGRLLEALCARAREALPAGGGITIVTEPGAPAGDRTVVLRVHDTGTALSDETRERLFEPYLPGPGGGKGQGLGMSVAYAAVNRLGGTISARTVPDGTDIDVSLPVGSASGAAAHTARAAPARPARPVEPGRVPQGKTGETILVAEDDENLRSLAVKVLAREGYSVLAARDGQEAVEIIERDGPRIRLALLDDVMPRMGGRAALARIQEIAPRLPVILCSGYAWHLDGDSPSSAGYWDILQKPWQPRELLKRVREGLESRR
jgi:CheY-like chemotaxis protein